MDFSALKVDEKLVEVLKQHGITNPTEIQAKTYPLAANGYDVVGVSQTGSGKTLAFILPIISQILSSNKPFHTLIITPTREISLQIADCIKLFSALGIRFTLLIGGEPLNQQAAALSIKPQIVVGTPGRIAKHITKTKNLKIGRIRKLVLDEADRFFEFDFLNDLELISKSLTKKTQALMFTATVTEQITQLSHLFMKSPRFIETSSKYTPTSSLRDYFVLVPEKYKLTILVNYLKEKKKVSVLLFAGMCVTVQKIVPLLQAEGVVARGLHGSMPQPKRQDVIADFRQCSFDVLVSTDLASRGLDIPHVDVVINYDLPNTARDYVHRVGRTARAGKEGVALTFVTQYAVGKYQRLEYVLKRKLPEMELKCYDDWEAITKKYKAISEELSGLKGADRDNLSYL